MISPRFPTFQLLLLIFISVLFDATVPVQSSELSAFDAAIDEESQVHFMYNNNLSEKWCLENINTIIKFAKIKYVSFFLDNCLHFAGKFDLSKTFFCLRKSLHIVSRFSKHHFSQRLIFLT